MADDEPVPKIPYSKGFRLSWPEVIRIAMLATVLVAVIVLQKPCADSVSKFVTSFDTGSGSEQMPHPGTVAPATEYKQIGSNATPEQIRDMVEKSKQEAAGSGRQ